MIDNFALAISHGLLAYVAWRLLWRRDLDSDVAPGDPVDEREELKKGFSRRA